MTKSVEDFGDEPELQKARAHIVVIVFEDLLVFFLLSALGGLSTFDCDLGSACTLGRWGRASSLPHVRGRTTSGNVGMLAARHRVDKV